MPETLDFGELFDDSPASDEKSNTDVLFEADSFGKLIHEKVKLMYICFSFNDFLGSWRIARNVRIKVENLAAFQKFQLLAF